MKSCYSFFVSMVVCAIGFQAQAADYPTEYERQQMMYVLTDVQNRVPNLVIRRLQDRPQKERQFLEHFRDHVYPVLFEVSRLNSTYGLLDVAGDRALYRNADEKAAWTRQSEEAQMKKQGLLASTDWKDALKKGHELSQGLDGQVASLVQRLYAEDQLRGFTHEQMPLVEKLTQLTAAVTRKANESKVTGHDLSFYQKELEAIEGKYRAGQITFAEATAQLDSIWSKGFHAKGHDISLSAAKELNEIAIIRTRLAQSKGYRTWAEYQLSANRFTHREGFRSPDDHAQFMRMVLEETKSSYQDYVLWLDKRNPSLDPEQIDNRNSFLLAPETSTLVSKYFPVETVNEFWKQTMIESGFDPSVFRAINLDSFPRENKQTHAYMAPLVQQFPRVVTVRDGSLDFVLPSANSENWNSPMIYIVQNARKDGIDAYSTVFHEGGHALDFAQRLNIYEHPFEETAESYAYSETASMTMERFFSDLDFMLEKGKSREGEVLSIEIAEKYLKNSGMLDALATRNQVFNALFDVLIWSEPYAEDGPQFVDRFMDLYDELRGRYFPTKNVYPEGVRGGSRMLATTHFYSGNVRYYGYIYADMVSQMTADYMWDHFEQTTGRRTFLYQPEMAEILVEGQYRRGFSVPFPEATEKLVGRRFDPSHLIRHINSSVEEVVSEGAPCVELLK